jgi:hypothetical protein
MPSPHLVAFQANGKPWASGVLCPNGISYKPGIIIIDRRRIRGGQHPGTSYRCNFLSLLYLPVTYIRLSSAAHFCSLMMPQESRFF